MSDNVSALAALAALRALGLSGPPVTRQDLDVRVAAIAEALDTEIRRARMLVSSVVVAQMLPEGVAVKGGMGIKLRLGRRGHGQPAMSTSSPVTAIDS